jgi:LmbE family N-acetylglucosaminyl deacetylase
MSEPLRLLGVFAHPDDETLGVGGTLAKYAAEGVDTYLVTATRGERGWMGPPQEDPGLEAMARIREAELKAAARALGICHISFLDYIDGDLDQAPHDEVVGKIVREIRRVKPQVVITFPPDGIYGHPDHIAISQFATAAAIAAADPNYVDPSQQPAHRVAKLYYLVETKNTIELYKEIVGDLSMDIDNVHRETVGWDDWAVTTRIDAACCWRSAYQAVLAHQSQLPSLGSMTDESEQTHERIFGHNTFYRAFSLVNSGRRVETDLFEGLSRDRFEKRREAQPEDLFESLFQDLKEGSHNQARCSQGGV